MKTPIILITGFLGAGKTTFLRRVIDQLDKKFAILMNEFGDVGIDTQIIQGKNINIQELLGGCVCCSLSGEFEAAIKEIIQTYRPEIIIVETTGVAEPDALVLEISENMPEVQLDSTITIADADSLIRFPQLGRTGKSQIEMADVILLNKIDLVTHEQLQEVKDKLRHLNKKAPLLETENCNIDLSLVLGIHREKMIKAKAGKHESSFQSFTVKLQKPVDRKGFEEFLKSLPKEVYRLKGFVPFTSGKTYLLSFVAGRYDFEEMGGQHELVFIGENLIKQKKMIIDAMER
ncbi:GTP-binding protein [Candidatus Woesearchaeota archaeon]|nr:GTP-binding protein [Candidatus Woesearchaeota archaeon]